MIAKTPLATLFARARKYSSLLAVTFFLPIIFNSGTHVVAAIGSFKITYEGLHTGSVFAFRILVLLFTSCLLIRTTPPEDMTRGLARVLSPLRYLGISQQRIATILSLAWTAIPYVWHTTRKAMFSNKLKNAKNLRNLIPLLSSLIAGLYLKTEPENNVWEEVRSTGKSHLL